MTQALALTFNDLIAALDSLRPSVTVCSSRYHHGRITRRLLIEGEYFEASEWEFDAIRKGASPAELGMFAFEPEDE